MPARERRDVGAWLIGYTFVCVEAFKPIQLWAPRLDPGAYQVVSFWNSGPIIGHAHQNGCPLGEANCKYAASQTNVAISLEWKEVTKFGLLFSPEEWAKRETHMPKPVILNKPKCARCGEMIDFSINGRLQGHCYECSRPKTAWERLGEEP